MLRPTANRWSRGDDSKPVNERNGDVYANCRRAETEEEAGIVVKRRLSRELLGTGRPRGLAAIVTIRMFVAILPISSLLRLVEFVEGTISFMPFSPPAPIPGVFAVIPSMICIAHTPQGQKHTVVIGPDSLLETRT